jgi:hypothetical protein
MNMWNRRASIRSSPKLLLMMVIWMKNPNGILMNSRSDYPNFFFISLGGGKKNKKNKQKGVREDTTTSNASRIKAIRERNWNKPKTPMSLSSMEMMTFGGVERKGNMARVHMKELIGMAKRDYKNRVGNWNDAIRLSRYIHLEDEHQCLGGQVDCIAPPMEGHLK